MIIRIIMMATSGADASISALAEDASISTDIETNTSLRHRRKRRNNARIQGGSNMNSSTRTEQQIGSPPSTSLSGEIQNGTQGSINTKKMMKWTREMNTEIIKGHFKALITVPDTYSKGLFEYFEGKFSNLHVTAQRLTDQKRAILERAYGKVKGKLRGGWLSREEVEAIEAEAKILYDSDESNQNRSEEILTENVENLSAENPDEIQEPESDETRAIITKIKIEFEKTKMTGFDNRKRFRKPPKKSLKKTQRKHNKNKQCIKTRPYCSQRFY